MARPRGLGGSLILDAQGLVKLAAGDQSVRALARKAREGNRAIVTAASTLAEVMRGGPRDAPVHQALHNVTVAPVTKDIGRKAGELLGATGMSGHRCTADALLAVVALAQERPAVLLTSDPHEMTRLTGEPHRRKSERIAIVAT